MVYVALIETGHPHPRQLPRISSLRKETAIDRLLWRLLSPPQQAIAPPDLDGPAIILTPYALQKLYGLSARNDMLCQAVQPHEVPAPMREEDLP